MHLVNRSKVFRYLSISHRLYDTANVSGRLIALISQFCRDVTSRNPLIMSNHLSTTAMDSLPITVFVCPGFGRSSVDVHPSRKL
ncbi:hypothetical protein NPIL_408191 [Nephila pilipes]|uniref:Uncharacterized protein n=1 Tax=Nephila pilipes TaxID=299642 RepID=A0A8X6PKZ1_NEPPI|nr:hypothetical protein NPIL_408191 [Nephila pilipes]